MTQAFAASETINALPSVVWATLTDWNRGPEWLPGVESMSVTGSPGVGSRVEFRTRGKDQSSTITAFETGRLVTMTSRQGSVRADYTYTLEEAGGATSVSLVADVHTPGAMKLLGPVIRAAIAKEDKNQLASLKALVERR